MIKPIKIALVFAFGIALSACSGGQTEKFIDKLDLKITQHASDSYVDMSTTFELGNVTLTQATFTVKDPRSNKDVGTVGFEQLPTGQGQINLSVNATLLANADADLGLSLPNGRELPLALNIERGDSMGIPVGDYSRIYLGGNLKTTIFAGVAFAIRGLDEVMDQLNTSANVFFQFRATDQLVGVGGIYASPEKNKNGVAVFAKYSRSGGFMSDDVDPQMDNEFYRMDRKSQNGMINFFYGKPRTIQVY